jgi:hypothetical protein
VLPRPFSHPAHGARLGAPHCFFSGQDNPAFLTIGSVFVLAAPFPALDTYVAAARALGSDAAAK